MPAYSGLAAAGVTRQEHAGTRPPTRHAQEAAQPDAPESPAPTPPPPEPLPAAPAAAPPSTFVALEDETLAYRFLYPTATSSGRALPLVFSRRPERYSSAAPLTADARQRIVCELADLVDAVTVSVTVRPLFFLRFFC